MTSFRTDAVIVGGGGAGLRAALEIARAGRRVAVVSKVFPTRSHTVSAQGGITAALGNVDEDRWEWHFYDTVKGGDWLGDQDAIEFMCREAPEAVIELEHMGLPFSRLADGRIYQRPFGGQSRHFGGAQATRTCAAADRTGHALLHTLYQQNLAAGTQFFDEFFALDLVRDDHGALSGVTALALATGDVHLFEASAVLLATGGAGRIFATTSNAHINTGDGLAMVLRAGLPLEDMEFWQFHPTGIAGVGTLISEAVRGEGGYLVNAAGERFMKRYAPHAADLAGRDVVARAIAREIAAGRGCGARADHVHLRLDHLGESVIAARLPGIRELAVRFAGIDPVRQPVPVAPTAHYMMGGIPVNLDGQVLTLDGGQARPVSGLYAVGECACVSVHGANRLGGNSLLDLVVFGRAAGRQIASMKVGARLSEAAAKNAVHAAQTRIMRWARPGTSRVPAVRETLRHTMQTHCGVFRTAGHLDAGWIALDALTRQLETAGIDDTSRVFNTARIEALELENLMLVARATLASARARRESRGAHFREDFPQRDDENGLRHTFYSLAEDRIDTVPVRMGTRDVAAIPPDVRIY